MYHSWRVRPLAASLRSAPKVALGGMLQIASVVVYIIFLLCMYQVMYQEYII